MFFKRFLQNQDGGVMVTMAVAIVTLVVAAGAAVDLGQQQLLKSRIQQSSDAGALAAAALSTPGVNTQQVALRYFNLNFSQQFAGVNRPSPSITPGLGKISVSANATAPTSFMGAKGVSNAAVGASSSVGAMSVDAPTRYNIVLVLDSSSSVSAVEGGATRLNAIKDASKRVSASLLTTDQDHQIAVVRYWNSFQTSTPSESKSAVDSFIDGMAAQPHAANMTMGLNPANAMLSSFGDAGALKIVILIATQPNESLAQDSTTNSACATIKGLNNPLIYTIGYGTTIGASAPTKLLLEQVCASNNPKGGKYAYYANTPAELNSVIDGILQEVHSIRMTQ